MVVVVSDNYGWSATDEDGQNGRWQWWIINLRNTAMAKATPPFIQNENFAIMQRSEKWTESLCTL